MIGPLFLYTILACIAAFIIITSDRDDSPVRAFLLAICAVGCLFMVKLIVTTPDLICAKMTGQPKAEWTDGSCRIIERVDLAPAQEKPDVAPMDR